tara:strand:- start:515 stop:970 length:456 start_codon:yes stop_codon:yes gene_type:complete
MTSNFLGFYSIQDYALSLFAAKSKLAMVSSYIGAALAGSASFITNHVIEDQVGLLILTSLLAIDAGTAVIRELRNGRDFKSAKAMRFFPKLAAIILMFITFTHWAPFMVDPTAFFFASITTASIIANMAAAKLLPQEWADKILKYIDTHKK